MWDHWYLWFGLLVTSPLCLKARVGSLIHAWLRQVLCFLRFTSGATPADLFTASMAAKSFSSRYLWVAIGGAWNWDLWCFCRHYTNWAMPCRLMFEITYVCVCRCNVYRFVKTWFHTAQCMTGHHGTRKNSVTYCAQCSRIFIAPIPVEHNWLQSASTYITLMEIFDTSAGNRLDQITSWVISVKDPKCDAIVQRSTHRNRRVSPRGKWLFFIVWISQFRIRN